MSTQTDQRDFFDHESLCASVERLHAENIISTNEKLEAIDHLKADTQDSKYILKHLGSHLAIAGVRYITMIPLPIGSTVRPLWVLTWRIIETVRGNMARARTHSLAVFLFAILPVLGYCAYLIALRKNNERFAFIIANHICYTRWGVNVSHYYEGRSSLGRWFIRKVVPTASVAFGRETRH